MVLPSIVLLSCTVAPWRVSVQEQLQPGAGASSSCSQFPFPDTFHTLLCLI